MNSCDLKADSLHTLTNALQTLQDTIYYKTLLRSYNEPMMTYNNSDELEQTNHELPQTRHHLQEMQLQGRVTQLEKTEKLNALFFTGFMLSDY